MQQKDPKEALSILAVTGLGGLVFIATGAAMAINMDGVGRLAGAAFAVLGVVLLLLAATYGLGGLRSAPPSQPGPIAVDPTRSVTYHRSREGYVDVIAGVGAAAFLSIMVAISWSLIGSGESAGWGFLLIAGAMWLFLVPATVVGLIRVIGDGTILTLSPDGLRLHGIGFIPWSDVARMEIEDLLPLVQQPNTRVIGSMRQLALHLRPGAHVPTATTLDSIYRWVAKGYLALGERAGRGRYHWLGVREREVAVRLEEILDVASIFHARVVGLDAYPADAGTTPNTTEIAAASAAQPAPTAPDPVLAAEIARVVAARGRDGTGAPTPSAPARIGISLATIAVVATVSWWLGGAMVGSVSGPGASMPWPILALGVLAGGLQLGYRHASRAGSWARRALAATIPLALIAFFGGVFTASAVGGRPPSASSPTAGTSGAEAPRVQAFAATTLPDHPAEHAIDGKALTTWNAGSGAPSWILVDLGAERSLIALKVLVEQTPAGVTSHNILVNGDDGGPFRLVHTFIGDTRSGQWLAFRSDGPIPGVRRIVIETVESPSWVAWREIVVEHD